MRANARAAAYHLGGDGSAVAALFWDAQKLVAAPTPARAKKEKLLRALGLAAARLGFTPAQLVPVPFDS